MYPKSVYSNLIGDMLLLVLNYVYVHILLFRPLGRYNYTTFLSTIDMKVGNPYILLINSSLPLEFSYLKSTKISSNISQFNERERDVFNATCKSSHSHHD